MKAGALLTLALSLLGAAVLAALCRLPAGAGGPEAGGYVCAAFSDAADGAALSAAFEKAGLRGALGPASPLVFLNEFSGTRMVGTAEFVSRVLEIDPRDDGFARRLHGFFVSGGECRFYIPREAFAGEGGREAIARRIREAAAPEPLAGLSSGGPARGRPFSAPGAAAFAAAWLLTALLAAFSRGRESGAARSGRARLFPLFVLLPCAVYGAAGCALAATLLAARRGVLYLAFSRYAAFRLRAAFAPPPETVAQAAASALAFAALCVLFGVPAPFAAALPACFLGADAAALFFAGRPSGVLFAPRFFPVPIRSSGDPKRRLPPSVPAFLLAAFVSAAAAASGPEAAGAAPEAAAAPVRAARTAGPDGLGAEDYARHYAFQSTFSYRNLNNPAAVYRAYRAGANGLLEEAAVERPPAPPAPPYPLERLFAAADEPGGLPAAAAPGASGFAAALARPLAAAGLLLAPFAFFAFKRRYAAPIAP